MSCLSKCGFILSGLLLVLPATNTTQAGATLPQISSTEPTDAPSGAVASGQIALATPRSGALADNGAPAGMPRFGTNYDWLIIAWWRWAVATPASINPLLKPHSTNCDAGIQPHKIRFLGGNFTGGADDPPVVRHCTVPRGTALFFPILNGAWLSSPAPKPAPGCEVFKPDPWYRSRPGDRRYKLFLREKYVPAGIDPKNPPGSLTLTIDGEKFKNLSDHYVRSSVFFNAILPNDNIFDALLGADCFNRIILSPNVGVGYHVFIPPLSPGRHTLRWTADATLPPAILEGTLHQDVTYYLTVER